MMHTSIYSIFWLLLYFGCISNSSLSQSNGTMADNKVLNIGKELWEETLPLKMGSRLYHLRGLKSSTWYEVKISYPASIPSSFSIQLKKDKLDAGVNFNRKLLNTEKLIFKAEDNQDPMYVLVSVEPAGVVAIPHASERDFVMFNIGYIKAQDIKVPPRDYITCQRLKNKEVCDELLLGIPHKSWWVVGLVILCLVLAFVAPCFLPSFLLQNNQPFHSADPTISKDS